MKDNPDMSKDYVNDPVMTAKLQKLIDIGIIRFDSRHGKVYPQHEVHDFWFSSHCATTQKFSIRLK